MMVVGDAYCDVMKSTTDARTQQINFSSSHHQLDQLINKPTIRRTKKSSNLTDFLPTNIKENLSASGVVHLRMSDHSLIYVIRKFVISKHKLTVREVRDYKHLNAEYFWGSAKMPIYQHNPYECWSKTVGR